MWQRGACAVVLLALVMTGAGCLAMSNSSTATQGRRISQASLEQVVAGETTRDWLIATFGEPTSTTKLPEGSEVLRYEYTETSSSSLCLFVLFGGSENKQETRSAAYFELKDGVVQRRWLEQ